VQLFESRRPAGRLLGEGEDRLRVDGHAGLRALEAVRREDLLVVDDDPVVDADHRSVADRVVVGSQAGVALRVVAHVDEHLARAHRNCQPVDERARPASLLVHHELDVAAAIGVADGVGSALGDCGQERLSRQGLIDR
jgi:hypothetical protein